MSVEELSPDSRAGYARSLSVMQFVSSPVFEAVRDAYYKNNGVMGFRVCQLIQRGLNNCLVLSG